MRMAGILILMMAGQSKRDNNQSAKVRDLLGSSEQKNNFNSIFFFSFVFVRRVVVVLLLVLDAAKNCRRPGDHVHHVANTTGHWSDTE